MKSTTFTKSIGVVMPAFNAEQYLDDALMSILSQTYPPKEIVIVNDGSTDATGERLRSWTQRSAIVRVITNKANMGVAEALNTGMNNIDADYIARMDADDIAMPDRLAKQIAFLESNPSVDLCGSFLGLIHSHEAVWTVPTENDEIAIEMLFRCCIFHPTVMLRKSLADRLRPKAYGLNYPHAEDYALWVSLIGSCRMSNLNEVLVKRRVHDEAVGQKHRSKQRESAMAIKRRQLSALGIDLLDDSELRSHELLGGVLPELAPRRRQLHKYCARLISANKSRKIHPEHIFERVVQKKFRDCEHLALESTCQRILAALRKKSGCKCIKSRQHR